MEEQVLQAEGWVCSRPTEEGRKNVLLLIQVVILGIYWDWASSPPWWWAWTHHFLLPMEFEHTPVYHSWAEASRDSMSFAMPFSPNQYTPNPTIADTHWAQSKLVFVFLGCQDLEVVCYSSLTYHILTDKEGHCNWQWESGRTLCEARHRGI